jgi:DNA-binding response OmpR family regulator
VARFLVLDNDRSMRGLLALALERGGHEVVQAGTVDEADAALAEGAPVDGMLLDLHLGGGHSGVSVVERWSGSQQLAPFLVVTGTPEDASLASLDCEEHFRGVLGKPFMIDELLERVAELPRVVESEAPIESSELIQAEPEPRPTPIAERFPPASDLES